MNDHQKKFSVFSASRGKITSSPIFCRGGEQIASPHYPRPFSLLPRPFSLRGSRGGPPTFCGVCSSISLQIIDGVEGYFSSPHSASDWSTPKFWPMRAKWGEEKFLSTPSMICKEIENKLPQNQPWIGSCLKSPLPTSLFLPHAPFFKDLQRNWRAKGGPDTSLLRWKMICKKIEEQNLVKSKYWT